MAFVLYVRENFLAHLVLRHSGAYKIANGFDFDRNSF